LNACISRRIFSGAWVKTITQQKPGAFEEKLQPCGSTEFWAFGEA